MRPQERRRDRRDVAAALAQGRHVDLDDLEPEVEVLPEASLFDQALHGLMGRRDDARLRRAWLLPTDRVEPNAPVAHGGSFV